MPAVCLLFWTTAFLSCAARETEGKFMPAARVLAPSELRAVTTRVATAEPEPKATDEVQERTDEEPNFSAIPRHFVERDDIAEISHAACEREVRCDNLGIGKSFVSFDTCILVRSKWDAETFPLDVCSSEISEERLHGCLEALRTTACEVAVDSTEMLGACQRMKLCGG